MIKRIAVVLSTFILAFFILSASFLRSSTLSRRVDAFSPTPQPTKTETPDNLKTQINYVLPYPGGILPDSPFWFLKAGRDKLWMVVTTNKMRKADLSLLFADKRLGASKTLFERNKPILALSTLTKAEKYLEQASSYEAKERQSGVDTKSFLMNLANASLKHREEIENMLSIAPDDIKPEVIKTEDYAINVYKVTRDALQSQGVTAPINPFDGK